MTVLHMRPIRIHDKPVSGVSLAGRAKVDVVAICTHLLTVEREAKIRALIFVPMINENSYC